MQISKTRNIIGWVLSAIPLLALIGGAFNKLSGKEETLANINKIGEINPALLGILSIVLVALYLLPKTSKIGFFLLCSYYGGVIVGEIAMGEFPLIGIVMSVLLYVGTMLKKPELSGLGI